MGPNIFSFTGMGMIAGSMHQCYVMLFFLLFFLILYCKNARVNIK